MNGRVAIDVDLVRVGDSDELAAALRADDPTCFPVLCPGDADATLTGISLRLSLEHGSGDVVVAAPGSVEEPLARRYALVTGRTFLSCSIGALPKHPRFDSLTSVTAFCPAELPDLPRLLAPLRSARGLGPLRLGLLGGQTPAHWSRMAARQLAMNLAEAHGGTLGNDRELLFVGTHYLVEGQLVQDAPEHERRWDGELVARRLEDWRGTLFIGAHSRPHCGILPVGASAIGLCGTESGGEAGRCVHGTACLFDGRPRVNLRRLQCRNFFFNGCTTAALHPSREEFLPRAALLTHAVCESTVGNFVGNDRAGHFSDLDQLWFVAACALGLSAAEAVILVDHYRQAAGHEHEGAGVLFGDALSPPWPASPAQIGVVSLLGENACGIEWRGGKRLLVAGLPGSEWAEIAAQGMAVVRPEGASLDYAGILHHPWRDESLLLAVRSDDPTGGEIGLRLERRRSVGERPSSGDRLEAVAAGLRHSLSLPGFSDCLPVGADVVARRATELRRAARDRHNLARTTSISDEQEAALAAQADTGLLLHCLDRSTDRWGWHGDFAELEQSDPARLGVACPACGAIASSTSSCSLIDSRLLRETIACGFCGIVSDWPWPELRVKLVARVASREIVAGAIGLLNRGEIERAVQFGVALRGSRPDETRSTRTFACTLHQGDTRVVAYQLTAAAPATGLMQLLLFAVCEGRIGVRSRMIFVGRGSEGESIDAG